MIIILLNVCSVYYLFSCCILQRVTDLKLFNLCEALHGVHKKLVFAYARRTFAEQNKRSMAAKFDAFIFDMNGTMIDDMAFHVVAWQHMLNEVLHANLSRDQVKKEMYGKNEEVLSRVFGVNRFSAEEAAVLSLEKEKQYQEAYLPYLALIKGLPSFLDQAAARKIPMAIGSAAIPFNIDFVLDNLKLRHFFSVVVSADDVKISKPHPETYLKAAALLGIEPARCLVFEDAPKGVEAAANAGMKAVAITTLHEAREFDEYDNVIGFIKDYKDPFIRTLL